MPGFSFDYAGHRFEVIAKPWSGDEQVLVNGETVSQVRQFGPESEHQLSLPALGELRLRIALDIRHQTARYELWRQGERLGGEVLPLMMGSAENPIGGGEAVVSTQPAVRQTSWLSLGLVAFKLIKAVNVFKVALMASSVAVYSLMFTLEFALALIAVLVFHEYGHLRAMKKFGIPTKGMYLIPFVGGLAVGDHPKTRWQDVYISMMGPVFGLVMTLVFYLVYRVTDSHFAGLVASTSALINLFNLIPVHPLDGGRVVKSLVFSGRNYLALIALLGISALCFVVSWKMGFYFIVFFIVLGVIDIITGWRVGLAEDITPLSTYGIWFCVLWYLVVVALFLGMIVLIAQDGLPGSEIALKVLSS
ncbi:site-2 protease family protein [Cellvibrio japonicus]|uniref:Zn-dependent protease n=1 Tax=Cellvibrio japonicus (strain Ueda107) TaxID=498211 RepID=B3PBI3_CELJU|nr:site-2 protease family protein [Cellvibrio japonicus]ACE85208.1 Zn-dependent protease [Cellvibrio japonicus Ueda107]QEI13097.1 site-2 protease family protein [Cellvibrio japonicus]QEI16671.1 site-2 protease family protein [Cellvibrio japonicus]QEI20249.1 site-2 protease family protein [Cellvibrio japonicus]